MYNLKHISKKYRIFKKEEVLDLSPFGDNLLYYNKIFRYQKNILNNFFLKKKSYKGNFKFYKEFLNSNILLEAFSRMTVN